MSSDRLTAHRQALQKLFERTDLRPNRRSGQHFLIDPDVVENLVRAAGIKPGEQVLEIGPGFGIVTDALLHSGAKVVAVELDRRLASYLERRYRNAHREIVIIRGDILAVNLREYISEGKYKLVASLPFNITSIVLKNFLEHPPRPSRLSLLVQKEVADRITAKAGRMSLLSVAVQYLGRPVFVSDVPRTSFHPQPEVDGAIVRIDVHSLPQQGERRALFRIARMGFSSRRKMLHNNLETGLHLSPGSMIESLQRLGLNPRCRPQELSVEQWLALSRHVL